MLNKYQNYNECEELLNQILPNKNSVTIQKGLQSRFGSLKAPRRAISSLKDFLKFISDHEVVIETASELSLFFHNYQEIYMVERIDRSSDTISSDLNSLGVTIEALQNTDVFPKGYIAPVMRQASKSLFKEASNDVKKVLGGLQLPAESKENDIPLQINVPPEEFLASLVTNIRRHRNTVLHISRSYLAEANSRLDYAKFAIDFVPQSLFDNCENVTLSKSEKGVHYSLFNRKRLGELARMNLISYLYHKNDGLVKRDFKGRVNRHSFGGTGEIREYFGLTRLSAVAAQNIIIIESGINVDSLRDLEVGENGCLKDFFRITDDGFNIIYDKWRADSARNKDMMFVDDSPINIDFAFKYLLRSTEHYRTLANSNDRKHLFIHDTMREKDVVCRISALPFKTGFTALLVKARQRIEADPSWCKLVSLKDIDDLLEHSPNAKQLRVSEGILRWYDSGGDPLVAANYLGNSESVAIKNYIPDELQNALYSQQISKFQHLLLAAATDSKPYQKDVLQLSSDDSLERYINQLDASNPNWRKLSEADTFPDNASSRKAMVMVMSKENITMLYEAFLQENQLLMSGSTPSDDVSCRSEIFKNMLSYVNAYGLREHKVLIRDTINSIGGLK